MTSETELNRIQETVSHLRADLQKLARDGDAVRDRERKAVSRIQADAERDYAHIVRKRADIDREIKRHELELIRGRAELERKEHPQHGQSHH